MNKFKVKLMASAQVKCYDSIVSALRNREGAISVDSGCNIRPIVEDIVTCSYEFFYLYNGMGIEQSIFGKRLRPQYVYGESEAQRIKCELDRIANSVIAELINDHQSDYDKALVLHDYLKTTAAYDYAALNCRPAFGGNLPKEAQEAHTMVGALINKRCVCEGFAKAYAFLCERAGVECMVVSGESHSCSANGPHAWNIVNINGHYHHVDVTWDNQFAANAEGMDIPNYSYFGLDDEQISRDHMWNESYYPKCPVAPYNYFRINNAEVDSESSLKSLLREKTAMEEDPIMFKIKSGSIMASRAGNVGNIITEFMNTAGRGRVGGYRIFSIPDNLVYVVNFKYK